MADMAAADSVRVAILGELAGKEVRPIDLLKNLGHKGYIESNIKEALSELLREGAIELTHQRILRVRASEDAA